MRYFIYRYKNSNGDIVYIGKTLQSNIKNRLSCHITDPIGEWSAKNEHIIEYIELPKEEDMNYIESYLIRKYLPIFNTVFVNKNNPPPYEIIIPEKDWKNIKDFEKTEKENFKKINEFARQCVANNFERFKKKCEIKEEDKI